jgi:hypothetical protein
VRSIDRLAPDEPLRIEAVHDHVGTRYHHKH